MTDLFSQNCRRFSGHLHKCRNC